jgi:hypothetical protein
VGLYQENNSQNRKNDKTRISWEVEDQPNQVYHRKDKSDPHPNAKEDQWY